MLTLYDIVFQLPATRQVHITWMLLDREFREMVEHKFYMLKEEAKTTWKLEQLVVTCYEEYRKKE